MHWSPFLCFRGKIGGYSILQTEWRKQFYNMSHVAMGQIIITTTTIRTCVLSKAMWRSTIITEALRYQMLCGWLSFWAYIMYAFCAIVVDIRVENAFWHHQLCVNTALVTTILAWRDTAHSDRDNSRRPWLASYRPYVICPSVSAVSDAVREPWCRLRPRPVLVRYVTPISRVSAIWSVISNLQRISPYRASATLVGDRLLKWAKYVYIGYQHLSKEVSACTVYAGNYQFVRIRAKSTVMFVTDKWNFPYHTMDLYTFIQTDQNSGIFRDLTLHFWLHIIFFGCVLSFCGI